MHNGGGRQGTGRSESNGGIPGGGLPRLVQCQILSLDLRAVSASGSRLFFVACNGTAMACNAAATRISSYYVVCPDQHRSDVDPVPGVEQAGVLVLNGRYNGCGADAQKLSDWLGDGSVYACGGQLVTLENCGAKVGLPNAAVNAHIQALRDRLVQHPYNPEPVPHHPAGQLRDRRRRGVRRVRALPGSGAAGACCDCAGACCDCAVTVLWLCCGCAVAVLWLCCGCALAVTDGCLRSDAMADSRLQGPGVRSR